MLGGNGHIKIFAGSGYKLPDEVEACGIAVIGHAAEEKEPHWGVDSSILHIGCWKE